MRATLPLLAVLVLAPFASAASSNAPRVEIAPFTTDVQPLQAAMVTDVNVTFSCANGTDGRPATATLRVAHAPPWATPIVSPSTFAAPAGCTTEATLAATLAVSASDQAPAHRAEPITLELSQETADGIRNGTAETDVTAGYFGILDQQTLTPVMVVAPGGSVDAHIRLTNLGNDRTRVHLGVANASGGLAVAPVEDVTLGSKQQGDVETGRDVLLHVTGAKGVGYLNRVGTIDVKVTSDSVQGEPGDAGTLSFVVTTKGLDLPLGAGAPLAALALAALALRARRG